MRPNAVDIALQGELFQPTHPCVDATFVAPLMRSATDVSTHASVCGCDRFLALLHIPLHSFNPRIRVWMRRIATVARGVKLLFQPTHPCVDATCGLDYWESDDNYVSTHASVCGCDCIMYIHDGLGSHNLFRANRVYLIVG